MKKIVKTHPPQQLTAWCNDNQDHNHSYRDILGTAAYTALKQQLIKEQGRICAYTGRAIDETSSHVEHLKPQNCCGEWEDVDYRNIVACFPVDGGDTSHGYGAPVKGGWWDETLFISPLTEECERRFKFTWSGHIYPSPDNHIGAKKTINIIGLDNDVLRKLRKSRINGFFGFGSRTKSKPLSVADARTALAKIDHPNVNGQLREFCFVIKQLLSKYIDHGGAP